MNEKSSKNNYLVIIIVLLLVVAIITGAGLCYLSWSDEYNPNGGAAQSTEMTDITESVVSTEESTETTETTEATESTETTETTEVETPVEDEGLAANTVNMEQIEIAEDGTYQYIKEGVVASHKGIDVSKYQGNVDWKKVAADGVEYAFIRVGCRGYGKSGTLIKDEKFHQNVKGALEQGIKVGAYFFTQAITKEEALAEAELVIKELANYEITYPVAIDVERVQNDKARQDALTAEERTEICKVFCEKIKEAGYIPMVYGDSETFAKLILPEELSAYDFWICETDGTMTFPYEFAVWQYSHKGKVSGIKNDTNISISLKEW